MIRKWKEGIIIKFVKMYLDEEFIKSRLGEEYKNCNVIFRNSVIGLDNTLTFECIITEDDIPSNDIPREKII